MSVLVALAGIAAAQSDPWTPLRVFQGKWSGESSGEPGKGVSNREYQFELEGIFCRPACEVNTRPKQPAGNLTSTTTGTISATIAP